MGFLDRLWDETVAGPAPDNKSLGKLRKYNSLSAVLSPNSPIVAPRYHDNQERRVDQRFPVSRSITILRTKSLSGSGPSSSPSSTPSGASSPFSPGETGTGKSPDAKKRLTQIIPTFEASEHA